MSTDAPPILEYTQPILDADVTLGTENAHNRWSATIPPVLTVPSGAVVELHTKEASDGQITESTGVDDLADIDFGLIHALTGPIYVEGATPGDVLAVTTVYLPVQVDGALFSIGDTRAAQGDGEVSGTAIEAPMRIVLTLEVIENTRGMVEPQYETGDYYAVTGFATTIDEAARKATRYTIDYLLAEHGLTPEEAYVLCSLAGNLKISETVDVPHMLVSMHIPDGDLPGSGRTTRQDHPLTGTAILVRHLSRATRRQKGKPTPVTDALLSDNQRKAEISHAFLAALAARDGYSMQRGPDPDVDSIDATQSEFRNDSEWSSAPRGESTSS